MVRWTIQAIHETVPSAEVVVCTDYQFGSKLSDLKPTILIPSVERHRPMYYRARTYNTIIQKKWCRGVTVFLDSDAIVLKDPSHLSKQLNFQVGVTSRFAPNLMPINEGVIITEARSPFCIDFFAHYMGTYEYIKNDCSNEHFIGCSDILYETRSRYALGMSCRVCAPAARIQCLATTSPRSVVILMP